MKVTGKIRVLKYFPGGMRIAVETPGLVGQNQFVVPLEGDLAGKKFQAESPFEIELLEEKPPEPAKPKNGKKK